MKAMMAEMTVESHLTVGTMLVGALWSYFVASDAEKGEKKIL